MWRLNLFFYFSFKTAEMPTNLKIKMNTHFLFHVREKNTYRQVNNLKSCLIRFCGMKSNDRTNDRNHWNQTFPSKFPARLEDHSLSPNNYCGSKCQSTVTQYEMSLLHCDVAEKDNHTLTFFFLTTHPFPVCKQKSMTVKSVTFVS